MTWTCIHVHVGSINTSLYCIGCDTSVPLYLVNLNQEVHGCLTNSIIPICQVAKKCIVDCPSPLGAVAKLSEAKRNEKFSFGRGGQRNSVGPFRFFLDKKLQLNFFGFLKGYCDPGY
jgi:hypothetical protein